jgi:L-lysine exporter family protein LysE/ArgO
MGSSATVSLVAGFGLGLSLIVAIGAQNAFVLRQGLRGEHVLPVVAVCAVSDALLITSGVAGLGALLQHVPWMLDAIRLGGAAFLLTYAVMAGRRAIRRSALAADAAGAPVPLWTAVTTAVALTWLNPHVYLDTVVLLGSVAASHGDDSWWFGIGAVGGSIAWFTGLGYGARFLRPLFARPSAWRVLDGLIAAVMAAIAASLLLGVSTA